MSPGYHVKELVTFRNLGEQRVVSRLVVRAFSLDGRAGRGRVGLRSDGAGERHLSTVARLRTPVLVSEDVRRSWSHHDRHNKAGSAATRLGGSDGVLGRWPPAARVGGHVAAVRPGRTRKLLLAGLGGAGRPRRSAEPMLTHSRVDAANMRAA